ncbi:DUF2642 domain-containing protein [Psychrobacillus sp. FJAT-51614]|uniref:DUF2642 domain-containing protein n=1 Tax=Psychrobacillus mangrovi TaxID=3117745 RepID=A0ABU8F631_9BACI
MNKIIQSLIKEFIQIEVSGKKYVNGTLIDLGSDVIVLFNGLDYMYIPLFHIQSVKIGSKDEYVIQDPIDFPSIKTEHLNLELSLNETLLQAKGKHVEIFIAEDQSLNGQVTRIRDDYFEFFSPIYRTMYISTKHLKWLIPIGQNESLYGLNNKDLSFPKDILADTFKDQIEKFINSLVVINIGGRRSHLGKMNKLEDQIIEIEGARTAPIYLNLNHIQTLHQV